MRVRPSGPRPRVVLRSVAVFAAAWISAACGPDDPAGTASDTSIAASSPDLLCGFAAAPSSEGDPNARCGANDPELPPEPSLPTNVCQTLAADKSAPDESRLDTVRIQAALTACSGSGAVRLVVDPADPTHDAFVTGHLQLSAATLWIDAGVTLYASRDPFRYQSDGNCGALGISDSNACLPLISASGAGAGIVGDGTIDGQGEEPILGHDADGNLVQLDYSWWDLSNALRASNGSAPNPALIEVKQANAFLLYRVTLHNSPKFHVKLSASSTNNCATPGSGFTVWGVTLLTPSVLTNSRGFPLTPYYARNTDGVDPGNFAETDCGVIACNTISTGDDQIAMKAAHGLSNIVVAHNHFGSGHGMSIGSETNGGVSNVEVYDLTIDADSRWNGAPDSNTADFNGVRVKSDVSRGGPVADVRFHDICVRDALNPIVVDSSYNPLFGCASSATGEQMCLYPEFQSITISNLHAVTCMALLAPVVDLQGFNATYPIGSLTLDNVVVDGITSLDTAAQYANIALGPRAGNFVPSGYSVNVANNVTMPSSPARCEFPPLPVAHEWP